MDKTLRVLIIDDNASCGAEIAKQFANFAGYKAFCCSDSGLHALEMIAEHKPDVVLVDMVMPGLDGIGILQAMQDRHLAPNALLCATSPFNLNIAILKKAENLGISYLFYKPFSAQMVFNRIMEMLEYRDLSIQPLPTARKDDLDKDEECNKSIRNYIYLMGARPHLKGYNYLFSAVRYSVDNYGRSPGVTTEIYPYVASLYNTTPGCVERNVRTAIEYAWNHGNIEAQHRLFGYSVNSLKGMPTAKECIALLCERTIAHLRHI